MGHVCSHAAAVGGRIARGRRVTVVRLLLAALVLNAGADGRAAPPPTAPIATPGLPPAVRGRAAPPTTALTFEPLGAILARAFALELEHRLVPGWSLAIQPAVLFASHAVADESGAAGPGGRLDDGAVTTEEALVWSTSLHVRAYLAGAGLDGLFVGPVLTWAVGGFRASADAPLPNAVAAGGLVGYSLVLGRAFLLSTGLGAQYHVRVDGGRYQGDDRLVPLFRLAIGATF